MSSLEDLKRESAALAFEFEKEMKMAIPQWSIPLFLLRFGAKGKNLRRKLLEFVDVLPALSSNSEIGQRLFGQRIPLAGAFSGAMAKWLVENKFAPYFIIKDEAELRKIKRIYERQGAKLIVDLLGEFVVSEKEARLFLEKYLDLINKETEYIAIKFSSLFPYFGPENYEESKKFLKERFEIILRASQNKKSFVSVDAEHYEFHSLIENIFCEVISQAEFKNNIQVEIALQSYLKDSFFSAQRLVEVAKKRNAPFRVRLVKGAYWDREVAVSLQKNWVSPVFQEKRQTDENYDQILYFLLKNWEHIHVSPATHNPENIAFAYQAAQELGILADENFEFQTLYGLGEPARKVLCARKIPVRVYAPIGDLVGGMAYFARRILENTANEGFLLRLISGNRKGG